MYKYGIIIWDIASGKEKHKYNYLQKNIINMKITERINWETSRTKKKWLAIKHK